MMVIRYVGLTIYTIDGTGFEPVFKAGDRVMVNRWSYGLRVGGHSGIFPYGRIMRQSVERGDLVVFEDPTDTRQIIIGRCTALPGDTVCYESLPVAVPGLYDCADTNYYWMEALDSAHNTIGFVGEEYIIGRVVNVVYSHDPQHPMWQGWRKERILLPL